MVLGGCSNVDETNNGTSASAGCEGGLVEVDGECTLLENTMEVLVFRTTTTPYVSTCTRRIISEDPGVDEAVIAESGPCRVIDTDMYGAPNTEPGALEPGVAVERDGIRVAIDEEQLFESCMSRSTIPDGFFDFGGEVSAEFGGNDLIPEFAASVLIPADPKFERSPVVDGEPITFRWTPNPGQSVRIVVAEFPVQIVCEANPAAGKLDVPADFVAMLPESDPPGLEPITSIRVRNQTVLAHTERDAAITLGAEAYQSQF